VGTDGLHLLGGPNESAGLLSMESAAVHLVAAVQRSISRVMAICEQCWESYFAGYLTRGEVFQCTYYLDMFRSRNRNELRRIPRRVPDDPRFCLSLGEGLTPFMFKRLRDLKDWYYLMYLPARKRRLYLLKASGEGAGEPEKGLPRGVEDETNGWTKLHEF
jgi:hypothetical protein